MDLLSSSAGNYVGVVLELTWQVWVKMPKKGKKGKGKKDNEGGLPPPPNIDDRRQGALEALLAFK